MAWLVTVVTVAIAIASAWFTYRTIPPRRRITIATKAVRLFQQTDESVHRALKIQHETFGQLADPSVVWITISNTGRAAVDSSRYDSDQPLVVRLNVPVVDTFATQSATTDFSKPPPVGVRDGAIAIGPGLLNRRQQTGVAVLVDGWPSVEVEHSLIDVEVQLEPVRATNERLFTVFGSGLVAIGLFALIASALVTRRLTEIVLAASLVIAGADLIVVESLLLRRSRKP
jgi:hypothetical protein